MATNAPSGMQAAASTSTIPPTASQEPGRAGAREDSPMPPQKPTHPSIECAKNGPYMVRNVETFTNSQGRSIPTRRTVALCATSRGGDSTPRSSRSGGPRSTSGPGSSDLNRGPPRRGRAGHSSSYLLSEPSWRNAGPGRMNSRGRGVSSPGYSIVAGRGSTVYGRRGRLPRGRPGCLG